jgi:hypothetical protein
MPEFPEKIHPGLLLILIAVRRWERQQYPLCSLRREWGFSQFARSPLAPSAASVMWSQ